MQKLFKEAVNDLRRQPGVVALYLLSSLAILAVYRILAHLLGGGDTPVLPAPAASLLRLALTLYLAVAASAVQAVFLAAFGAGIARPLWKYKGWHDALRRFFIPWLILNLLLVTITDICARLMQAEQTDVAATLELLLLAVHMATIPVGGAIMFWGGLEWRELPTALAPLGRFFQWTLLPLAVALLQYMLIELRSVLLEGGGAVTLAGYSASDLPLVLIDLLIFALVWRICLHNQMNPGDNDEDPLDF